MNKPSNSVALIIVLSTPSRERAYEADASVAKAKEKG